MRSQYLTSIRNQNTCLACAHIYVGCDTVRMNIPQKVIVVESQKCDTVPQNTPFMLQRAPEKGNNVQVPTIDKHPICVDWALASLCILSKKLSLHWQLSRKSSCCVPIRKKMKIQASQIVTATMYLSGNTTRMQVRLGAIPTSQRKEHCDTKYSYFKIPCENH